MRKITLMLALMMGWAASSSAQLSEDFENGKFSSDWKVTTLTSKTGWEIGRVDSLSELSNQLPFPSLCDDYVAIAVCGTGQKVVDHWLITPQISIEEGQYLNFMLCAPNAYASTHDTLDIIVSTEGNDSIEFTDTIYRLIPRSTIPWGVNSVSLADYAGKSIYIAFRDYHHARGSFVREVLYIDNITISSTPSYDLSVEEVISPVMSCNTTQDISLLIKNNGVETSSLTVSYTLDDGVTITETLNKTIAAGASDTITLSNQVVLQEGQEHTIVLKVTNGSEDIFTDNDTISTTISIGAELEYPYTMPTDSVEVTADFTSLRGSLDWTYTIADEDDMTAWSIVGRPSSIKGSTLMSNCISPTSDCVAVNFSYYSSDAVDIIIYTGAPYSTTYEIVDTIVLPVAQSFTDVQYNLYTEEASLSIGFAVYFPNGSYSTYYECAIRDIAFSDATPDIKASQIISPSLTKIAMSDAETSITVKYSYVGIGSISDLSLCYQVGDGDIVRETVSQTISEGEDYEHTFATSPVFNEAGKQTLTIWSESATDTNAANDTITTTITVYEAKTFPYSTTFYDAVDWSVINVDEDDVEWMFIEFDNAIKDGVAAYKNYYSGVSSDDYLVSPAITMPEGDARISFYYATGGYAYLSVLMGTSPDNLDTVLFDEYITNTGWLNGYANFTIEEAGVYYFAFYGYGTGYATYLDYVNIDAEEDICTNGIAFSETSGFDKTTSDVTISFINHGVTAQSNVEVGYIIGQGKMVSETVSESVEPGDTLTYTFTTAADISTPDSTYTLMGVIVSQVGEDVYNDTIIGSDIEHWASSTIPYAQGFEDGIDRWTLKTNTYAWSAPSNSSNSYQGKCYLYHASVSSLASDDWAFSESIEIPAGTYDLSYFYRTYKNMKTAKYAQHFEVLFGTAPEIDSMTTTIAVYDSIIESDAAYKKFTGTLNVDADGKYYIGFHCYSAAGAGGVYIDSIRIEEPKEGVTLPYTSDFENALDEWTRYNPTSIFYQWTYTTDEETEESYLDVYRKASYNNQEGMLVSPALYIESGTPVTISFDYAVISNADTITLDLYYGTEDNPYTMEVLQSNTEAEELTPATATLEVHTSGLYYIGFESSTNSAVYELQLTDVTVSNDVSTGIIDVNTVRKDSHCDVYYTLSGVKVNKSSLTKGVYIIDGRKYIVK